MSESKRPQLPQGESGTTDNKADLDRMERQLAAAERLYEAAKEGQTWLKAQEWDVSLSAIVALEKALADYANAKEQK